jgi:hypothetical protein
MGAAGDESMNIAETQRVVPAEMYALNKQEVKCHYPFQAVSVNYGGTNMNAQGHIFNKALWRSCLGLALGLCLVSQDVNVWAAGFKSPEECTAYTGDAHLNCLYAYIELQKDKLTKFDDELKAQKGSLGQLRDQVDRQAAVTNDLQRGMTQQSAAVAPPLPAPIYTYPPVAAYGYPYAYPYGYPYGYPPAAGYFGYGRGGFSIGIGSPYYYGPGFYFYGRGFYGGHGFRHHRR